MNEDSRKADLAETAAAQIDDLVQHFESKGRDGAARHLLAAVSAARTMIGRSPGAGRRSPRPYPTIAEPGVAWIKEGRYWFAYTTDAPPIVVGVFYDTADIPGRS